jgi:hypothetical protein
MRKPRAWQRQNHTQAMHGYGERLPLRTGRQLAFDGQFRQETLDILFESCDLLKRALDRLALISVFFYV